MFTFDGAMASSGSGDRGTYMLLAVQKRQGPLLRRLNAFFEGPASVRHAIRAIVVASVVTTALGAVLMRLFDEKDFPRFGDALWWAVQTVTTVGYGDITPHNSVGRLIGGAFLLYSVAFLTILTAAITTSFIARARIDRSDGSTSGEASSGDLQAVLDRLDDIVARLERLEQR
jgi:voltage-gated potassium channel Kch